VDIFDHVTSLARASRSRVSKNDIEPVGPLHSSLVCHDNYPCAAAAPAFRPLCRQHCLEINSA